MYSSLRSQNQNNTFNYFRGIKRIMLGFSEGIGGGPHCQCTIKVILIFTSQMAKLGFLTFAEKINVWTHMWGRQITAGKKSTSCVLEWHLQMLNFLLQITNSNHYMAVTVPYLRECLFKNVWSTKNKYKHILHLRSVCILVWTSFCVW